MILVVSLVPRTAASSCEIPKHVDAYSRVQWTLPTVVPQVLEARLIDSLRAQDLRIGDLHGMFCGRRVVASFGQHRSTDPSVLLCVAVILIAGGERVVSVDLVVEARTDVGAGMRVGDALAQEIGRAHV